MRKAQKHLTYDMEMSTLSKMTRGERWTEFKKVCQLCDDMEKRGQFEAEDAEARIEAEYAVEAVEHLIDLAAHRDGEEWEI